MKKFSLKPQYLILLLGALVILIIAIYILAPAPLDIDQLIASSRQNAAQSRIDDAIADMDAAIALAPDDPALYVERGQRIILLYEWDRALADYDYELQLDPAYADAYFYRGVLYASVPAAGEARAQAIADFTQYLTLAPDGAHATEAQQALAALASAEG